MSSFCSLNGAKYLLKPLLLCNLGLGVDEKIVFLFLTTILFMIENFDVILSPNKPVNFLVLETEQEILTNSAPFILLPSLC